MVSIYRQHQKKVYTCVKTKTRESIGKVVVLSHSITIELVQTGQRVILKFQNKTRSSFDQLKMGELNPYSCLSAVLSQTDMISFHLAPSVLSTRLNKSVYFRLGGDCACTLSNNIF